jgi:ribose transport system substrate-binding protein
MQRRLALTIAGALLAGSMLAGHADAQDKKTLALVTNASADFWTIARRGVEKAATELPNYNTEMYVVSEATAAEQRRILDDLLTKGIAGVSLGA